MSVPSERKPVHYSIHVYHTQGGQPIGNPVLNPPPRIHKKISWFTRHHEVIAAIESSPRAALTLQPGTVYALRVRYTSSKGKRKKLCWPKFNFHAVPQYEGGQHLGYSVVRCK